MPATIRGRRRRRSGAPPYQYASYRRQVQRPIHSRGIAMSRFRCHVYTLAMLVTSLTASPAYADHDDAIAKHLTQALIASGSVEFDAVTVTVVNGAAELAGTVRSSRARENAERTAGLVGGVTAVRNLLTVRTSPGDLDGDEIIANRVRAALRDGRLARGEGIVVHAFNGEIDLSGSVGSDGDRRIAARIAGETRGVTAVRNALVIPMQ